MLESEREAEPLKHATPEENSFDSAQRAWLPMQVPCLDALFMCPACLNSATLPFKREATWVQKLEQFQRKPTLASSTL